jgi:hypothetical protein
LHSLFYPNGTKIIPDNIYELLTPIALAHVIMGDGNALSDGLTICTNSYTIQDVVRLMNVLIIRYKLECILRYYKRSNQKIEYMIYIRHSSMALLLTIVKSYMHPSMLYKLENRSATSSAAESSGSNPLALRSQSELGSGAGQRGIISCANPLGFTGVNSKVYYTTSAATNNQVVRVYKRRSSTTRSTPNRGGSALAAGSYSTFINDVNVKEPKLNPY